jgi:hypothetical protein
LQALNFAEEVDYMSLPNHFGDRPDVEPAAPIGKLAVFLRQFQPHSAAAPSQLWFCSAQTEHS